MWHGGTAQHIQNHGTTWKSTISKFKLWTLNMKIIQTQQQFPTITTQQNLQNLHLSTCYMTRLKIQLAVYALYYPGVTNLHSEVSGHSCRGTWFKKILLYRHTDKHVWLQDSDNKATACMRTRALSRAGMHKYQVQSCDDNNILYCSIFVDCQ